MADSIADFHNYTVILLHGPLYVRKFSALKRKFSDTHKNICPEDLFRENPSYGLRDIALLVIKTLKRGGKVVIDADNATVSSRLSYITLIRNKLPHTPISTIEILPKYGCEQLFWAREYYLAQKCGQTSGTTETRQNANTILKWFASEDALDVTYKKGIVEAPDKAEGAKTYRLNLGLSCETLYKFEVPGLLIQWDVLQVHCKDGKLQVGAVTKVLRRWSSLCPCGRIILICDGAVRSGARAFSQTPEEISSVMRQLTESFCDMPVYVLTVSNPALSGGFVVPPRPGLLAYLQCRHCLDLHSKHTVYLYEDQLHMKLAERAGIPHLKGSRVIEHPSLITSGHAATIPPIPEMLKTMELTQQTDDDHSGAVIPMVELIDEFADGFMKCTTMFGRTEYLFAKDVSWIERYQALYASKATKVGEPGSKIAEEIENQSTSNQQMASQLNTSAIVSHRTSDSRELPKWMLPRDKSDVSAKSSLDMSRSDSTSSADGKIKQTVYVMTEKELTEVAIDILKQAGRTDLVEQFEARQKQTENNRSTCSITPNKKRKTQNEQSDNKKSKQCNVEKKDKSHSISTSSKPTGRDKTKEKVAESDSDDWNSENESEHRHHVTMTTDKHVTENDQWRDEEAEHVTKLDQLCDQEIKSDKQRQCDIDSAISDNQEVMEKSDYCVEDVVNDALDDFLGTSSNIKRKTRPKPSPAPSPAKHRKVVPTKQVQPKTCLSSTPRKTGKSSDSLMLETETASSQRNFNRNILGKSDSVGFSSVMPTVESPGQKGEKSGVRQHEKGRRHTPDLTILDELFG